MLNKNASNYHARCAYATVTYMDANGGTGTCLLKRSWFRMHIMKRHCLLTDIIMIPALISAQMPEKAHLLSSAAPALAFDAGITCAIFTLMLTFSQECLKCSLAFLPQANARRTRFSPRLRWQINTCYWLMMKCHISKMPFCAHGFIDIA